MKQILSIALSILFFVSCQQETEVWQENNTGFLMLTSVKAEVEQVNMNRTRAVDESFTVEILREDGSPVKTYQPGELTQQKIQLEAGNYQLKAYTANHNTVWQNGEKGEAQYYKEQNFAIVANQLNSISMEVPMSNTAISLKLPEGFNEWFHSYSFSLTQGERTVSLLDGETAYISSGAKVSYTLSATNADEEAQESSNFIESPEANKQYEISYSLLQHGLSWQTYR